MITQEEYEEAQELVWDYEDQLKEQGKAFDTSENTALNIDIVSNSDTVKKYYDLINKCEEVIFNDEEEDQTGKIAEIVYEHLNIGS